MAIRAASEKMRNGIGMRQLQSEALALQLIRQIRWHTDDDTYSSKSTPHSPKGFNNESKQPGISKDYMSAQSAASYARQAIAYAAASETASLDILPVLRYYQWLHTLKTLLYLFDSAFPRSTSVLQHGLSVRRIKRSNYKWPLEKIMVHKEGIIQTFHGLCDTNVLPEKVLIGDLLGSLPHMAGMLARFYNHLEHAFPLDSAQSDQSLRLVSRRIASSQGLTIDEWRQSYYEAECAAYEQSHHSSSDVVEEERLTEVDSEGEFYQSDPLRPIHNADPHGYLYVKQPTINHPWLRQYDGIEFLVTEPSYPVYLVHYTLLYGLSALSRYSATEWSDIIHWQNEQDALLVREYLRLPLPHPIINVDKQPITVNSIHWLVEGESIHW